MFIAMRSRVGKFFIYSAVFLLVAFFAFAPIFTNQVTATVEDFTTGGAGVWTAPAGVTSVQIECWGAGGAGGAGDGNNAGGGGGGGAGAYAIVNSYSVTPGANYNYTVGTGGVGGTGNGGNGSDSDFATTTCVADAGSGGLSAGNGNTAGAAGTAGNSTGDTTYSGGTGGAGQATNGGTGGGGASSGGTSSAGNNGTDGASGGAGGTAVTGGGAGGAGGGDGVAGTAGSAPGGGGGGGGDKSGASEDGGSGADGKITLTYTADLTGPTPSTMYFATSPVSTTTDIVRMVSVTATDPTTPIQYYFEEVAGDCGADHATDGNDSGWQTSTIYRDTGLSPNKCYAYQVTARDGGLITNSTSTASSTYTRAAVPGQLVFTNVAVTSFDITNDENGNPTSNPATTFAVYATSSDASWNQKYVDSSGNPTDTRTWLTDSQVNSLTVDNLLVETEYRFVVVARNADNIITASSTLAATTTLADTIAPTPNPPYFTTAPNPDAADQVSMTSVTVTDNVDTTPEYYFTLDNATCAANTSGTGGTNSGWQTSASYSDNGLEPNHCYGYKITTVDDYANTSATSTASTTFTLANVPGSLSFGSVTDSSFTITNNENSNPTGGTSPDTEFAVYATSSDATWNQRYVDSGGSPNASPQWLTDSQIDGLSIGSLDPSTEYRFVVLARNSDNILTASSTMSATTTAPDTTPPTPSPLLFEQSSGIPTNASVSQIDMTSDTASDFNTPISYYFTLDNALCGADAGTGGDSSGWQSGDNTYSDTGLEVNHCYGYKVTARDSVGNANSTSTASTTYTSAATPGAPTLGTATKNSLTMVNDENGNPTGGGSPDTEFAVYIQSTSPVDASHDAQYIDGAGDPSASAVWLTDSEIQALTMTGLESSTTYTIQVKARNGDNDETGFGATADLVTTSAGSFEVRMQGVRLQNSRLR